MSTLRAIGLALLIFITGCGKVADPQPPFIRIPEAISDLSANQTGLSVVLTWTNPARNIDGSTAMDLARVHVISGGQTLSTLPAGPPGASQSFSIPAQQWLNTARTYAVRVETTRQKYADSQPVTITPIDVPGPVNDLRAGLDQFSLNITWQPPSDNGNLANGYIVRRLDRPEPLGIIEATQTKDDSYEMDKEYTYEVTPARKVGERWIPGYAARSVTVTAVDKTAPKVPVDVQVVLSDAGAFVTWNANEEADVRGYRIYRSNALVNSDLRTVNSYFDSEYRPGLTYAISAVDQFGNESQRSAPVPQIVRSRQR